MPNITHECYKLYLCKPHNRAFIFTVSKMHASLKQAKNKMLRGCMKLPFCCLASVSTKTLLPDFQNALGHSSIHNLTMVEVFNPWELHHH